MIEILALLLLLALLLAVALAAALAGLRRRTLRLEGLLEDLTGKLERLHLQFGRFTPPDVIERLTAPDGNLTPTRRNVTVLFADLKGFTSMCDWMDPAEVVTILNGYFQCMSDALAAHHGRISELVGDGLLALYGALEPDPWQAQDAVLGALAMRAALAKYNEELRARAQPELAFGIGIHKGDVLAGVMGNQELSKFGVVGDTINLASRVESLTRVHNVDLLITEEVRTVLDARFRLRCMPATPVKGKPEPIVTYYVEGLQEQTSAAAS